MAVDIDKTTAAISIPMDSLRKHFVLKNAIDFTVTANQLANAKTMAIFDIPANCLVEQVRINVTTADADVTTVDVGVVANDDGFYDQVSFAATGWLAATATGNEVYAPHTGFLSTTDAVLIITNTDADTINGAVVEFFAICQDLN